MRSGNHLAKKLSYSDSHVRTTLAQADTKDTDKVGGGQPVNNYEYKVEATYYFVGFIFPYKMRRLFIQTNL